jgi:hypothetical protein
LKFQVELEQDGKFDDVKKIAENAVIVSFLERIARQL